MARSRRLTIFCAVVFSGLLVCAHSASAEDIAVIVARDAPAKILNVATLRDIYLKKIILDASGRKLIPLNLPADTPLRQAFTLTLFHKCSDELQDYWNQTYFHGITPPYVLGSQDAVVRFVAQTPGAIGYVASCYLNPSVRQVLTLSLNSDAGVDSNALCPPGMGGQPGAAE